MSDISHNDTTRISKWFLVIFFVSALVVFFWQRYYWPKEVFVVNNMELHALVARSMYQQYRGLGNRSTLEPYHGMVFPYLLQGRHGIVMRDMLFPIDIIWLRDGVVVDIATNVPVDALDMEGRFIVYYPRTEANMVIEMPAGGAERYGFAIGTRVRQK